MCFSPRQQSNHHEYWSGTTFIPKRHSTDTSSVVVWMVVHRNSVTYQFEVDGRGKEEEEPALDKRSKRHHRRRTGFLIIKFIIVHWDKIIRRWRPAKRHLRPGERDEEESELFCEFVCILKGSATIHNPLGICKWPRLVGGGGSRITDICRYK